MDRLSLIWVIFCKELIEILRDRRSVAAVIVVPLILYPCLLIFAIRAAQKEQSSITTQPITVQVNDDRSKRDLEWIISTAADSAGAEMPLRDQFVVVIGSAPQSALSDHIQLHVSLTPVDRTMSLGGDTRISVVYSESDAYSRHALERFRSLVATYSRLVARHRLSMALSKTEQPSAGPTADPESLLQPLTLEEEPLTTHKEQGAWFLGFMLPAILVVMAIMSSIHPATDLTAGERERGTLETLLVTPTPVGDIVLGKYLVVLAVGMLTAAINVISIGATLYIGGMQNALIRELPIRFSLSTLSAVLLCMIPFSMLFAAVLIAVCSFARTFKEAQSYVTPIGICSLFLAYGANLPSVRLEGFMLVVPVGNMALLVRELIEQKLGIGQNALIVLLSTTLYAIAVLLLAMRLFGQEAIMFANPRSYGAVLARRLFPRRERPTTTHALLLAAILFPIAFYLHTLPARSGSPSAGGWLLVMQQLFLFIFLPACLAIYLKADLARTFGWRPVLGRAWVTAVLIGLPGGILASELRRWGVWMAPMPLEAGAQMSSLCAESGGIWLTMLFSLLLAVAQESMFRGFILSGLTSGMGRWAAILASALVFAAFSTLWGQLWPALPLGVLLACLALQAGSIWPCVLVNTIMMCLAVLPGLPHHLPGPLLAVSGILCCAGLFMCRHPAYRKQDFPASKPQCTTAAQNV